jgi:hypothetical protein
MSDSRTPSVTGVSRRSLAKTLGGAAAAAMLPAAATGAEEHVADLSTNADARIEALVEAALAATPASLTPEQRLDVRRGVRDLQKEVYELRKTTLADDVDPATEFLPGGHR